MIAYFYKYLWHLRSGKRKLQSAILSQGCCLKLLLNHINVNYQLSWANVLLLIPDMHNAGTPWHFECCLLYIFIDKTVDIPVVHFSCAMPNDVWLIIRNWHKKVQQQKTQYAICKSFLPSCKLICILFCGSHLKCRFLAGEPAQKHFHFMLSIIWYSLMSDGPFLVESRQYLSPVVSAIKVNHTATFTYIFAQMQCNRSLQIM